MFTMSYELLSAIVFLVACGTAGGFLGYYLGGVVNRLMGKDSTTTVETAETDEKPDLVFGDEPFKLRLNFHNAESGELVSPVFSDDVENNIGAEMAEIYRKYSLTGVELYEAARAEALEVIKPEFRDSISDHDLMEAIVLCGSLYHGRNRRFPMCELFMLERAFDDVDEGDTAIVYL